MEGKEVFLIIGVFLLLTLMMNPSLITVASGSIVGDTFTNVWVGFGSLGQSMVLVVAFILLVVFLVNKK